MTETPASELGAERMQRLLSRAVEEQVSEQRQAATLLSEVRASLAVLEAGLRVAASQETVDRLDSSVSTVVADLRTSTALLSQRLETLSSRVEAVAAETAAPAEQASVRLAALAAEVSAHTEAVERVQSALVAFETFPAALAAVQRDIAGLHDRLAPLGDLQAAVADAGARTVQALDALRPELEALGRGNQTTTEDVERVRDAVVDALGARLARLEEAAERPVVGPDLLTAGLGDLRANVRAAVGEQVGDLAERVTGLQQQLDALARLAGRVPEGPDLSGDLTRLSDRVEALSALPNQVEAALAGIAALRSDTSTAGVRAALETFADGAAHLSEQVARITVPSVDDVSSAVSARVADRLVEVLAPRIADVVLTRVSAALVTQLGEAIAPRLREESDDATRAVVAESEKRVLAHVDEAVLALAEALLRRKGLTRAALVPGAAASEPAPGPERQPESQPESAAAAPERGEPTPVASEPVEVEPESEPVQVEPVHEVMAELAAEGPSAPAEPHATPASPRPAVTTSLAPAPVPARADERGAQDAEPVASTPARPAKGATASESVTRKPPSKPSTAQPAAATAGKKAPEPVEEAPADATQPDEALRPARPIRHVPILERTPDLAPPSAPPLGTGRPAPPAVPKQSRPAAPAAPPPAAVPEPEKKRRWWRSGE